MHSVCVVTAAMLSLETNTAVPIAHRPSPMHGSRWSAARYGSKAVLTCKNKFLFTRFPSKKELLREPWRVVIGNGILGRWIPTSEPGGWHSAPGIGAASWLTGQPTTPSLPSPSPSLPLSLILWATDWPIKCLGLYLIDCSATRCDSQLHR